MTPATDFAVFIVLVLIAAVRAALSEEKSGTGGIVGVGMLIWFFLIRRPLVRAINKRREKQWQRVMAEQARQWRDEEDDKDRYEEAGNRESEDRSPPLGARDAESPWEILGLEPGASEGEIKRARNRAMKAVHSDVSGLSDYFAKKVNWAYERCIAEARKRQR